MYWKQLFVFDRLMIGEYLNKYFGDGEWCLFSFDWQEFLNLV